MHFRTFNLPDVAFHVWAHGLAFQLVDCVSKMAHYSGSSHQEQVEGALDHSLGIMRASTILIPGT